MTGISSQDLAIFEEAVPRWSGLPIAFSARAPMPRMWRRIASSSGWMPIVAPSSARKPGSTTVCTRRCLDVARLADRSRVDYVGPWLPEPIQPATPAPDVQLGWNAHHSLSSDARRLSPRERAAYLAATTFSRQSYADIAAALDLGEDACRQLVTRARAHIERGKARYATPVETQDRLLHAFESAVKTGDPAELAALLSSDVRLTADGGGKVPAALRVLDGPDVTVFLGRVAQIWKDLSWTFVDLNGGRGVIMSQDGVPQLTMNFAGDKEGRISDIFIMRNPDKLAHLDPVAIH